MILRALTVTTGHAAGYENILKREKYRQDSASVTVLPVSVNQGLQRLQGCRPISSASCSVTSRALSMPLQSALP